MRESCNLIGYSLGNFGKHDTTAKSGTALLKYKFTFLLSHWRLAWFTVFALFLQNVAQLKIYFLPLPLQSQLQIRCRELTISRYFFAVEGVETYITGLYFARAVSLCSLLTPLFSAVLHDLRKLPTISLVTVSRKKTSTELTDSSTDTLS